MDVLLNIYEPTTRPGKQRIVWVLGEFAGHNPNDTRVAKIINLCLSTIRSNLYSIKGLPTVGRNAVVALGKVGSQAAESQLISMLDNSRVVQIRGDILVSLGKCATTLSAFEHVSRYIDSGRESERIGSVWAIGRMGSREHSPRIPIDAIQDLISNLGQRAVEPTESHIIVRKYAVYALGEIGDRRSSLGHRDVVSDDYADYILKVLKLVQKRLGVPPNKADSLNGENRNIANLAQIALKQVEGNVLTAAEVRVLMAVRTLMSVSEED
jgi:HEAT repeat protein